MENNYSVENIQFNSTGEQSNDHDTSQILQRNMSGDKSTELNNEIETQANNFI